MLLTSDRCMGWSVKEKTFSVGDEPGWNWREFLLLRRVNVQRTRAVSGHTGDQTIVWFLQKGRNKISSGRDKPLGYRDKVPAMYHRQIETVVDINKSYPWLKGAGLKEHRGTNHGSTRTGQGLPSYQTRAKMQAVPRYPWDSPTHYSTMLDSDRRMERHKQVAGIIQEHLCWLWTGGPGM